MEYSLFLAKLLGVILVVGPTVKSIRHQQFVEACERAYRGVSDRRLVVRGQHGVRVVSLRVDR